MEQFFIDPYTFVKKAGKILSGNQVQWPNDILEELYKRFPTLVNFPQSINYASKNDEKGSAFGEITVGNKLCIPFIIDSFELKPLMVAHLQGQDVTESMPLNEQVIEQILLNKSFDKKLVSKSDIQKTPVSMSGTYIKSSSLLDILDGSITMEDKKELLEKLSSDERMLATLGANRKVIEKISSMETNEIEKEASSIEPDIEFICKEGSLGWTKVTGSTKYYSPSKTILKEAEATEESFKAAKSNPMIKKASYSDTINYDGKDYRTVNLDSRFSPVNTLLVSNTGDYISDLEKSAEWDYSDNTVEFDSSYKVKDSVLVKVTKDNYIGPVKLASVYSVKGNTVLHGEVNFEKLSFVESPVISKSMYDASSRTVYVPKIETVKIASKIAVKKPIEKIASTVHSVTARNKEYILQGPEFKKYASLISHGNPFTRTETIWALLQTGASEELVKQASELKRGTLHISESLECPLSKEASVREDDENVSFLKNYIDNNFKGLLKEAAIIANPGALDTILGLNLINENNILILLQNMGVIDGALNILSRLWLLSCVGLKPFDSNALEFVIEKLSAIKQTLQNLSYLVDKK